MKYHFSLLLSAVLLLSACNGAEQDKPELSAAIGSQNLTLEAASFDALPGWGEDDFVGFQQAFESSCVRILKKPSAAQFGVLKQAGVYGHWQNICRKFRVADMSAPQSIKEFFETHFVPHQVLGNGDPVGMFTGYYEASLKGSLRKTAKYNVPLHTRPNDLVMVQLGDFRDDLKGTRIAGRVEGGNLKPYESREQIVNGQWPHKNKVLVWVDDPVDAFFVQIQGSGIVDMANGKTMRIGYAGQNGHPYYAIGRELVKMGELKKEEVSMQSIRAWLAAHPTAAANVMNTNQSYVFFTKTYGSGPKGAEGVELTPRRSLAVDRTLMSYGAPMWVDIEHPNVDEAPIRRMMVAQDTGGAITGPVRGDVFWGYGAQAEEMAGKMRSYGSYWVLLPKALN